MTNQIKLERARYSMTQAELADKVSVARQTIIAIESGRFVPSTVLALKIACILNIKPDELFVLEDKDWE
jgi:putative transcriptional regulator